MRQSVFSQYQDKGLDDYKPANDSQEEAVDTTRRYIADLSAMKAQGKGITFMGPNGVGKTHLACTVMAAVGDVGYPYECIELSSYIELYQDKFGFSDRLKFDDDGECAWKLDKLDDRIKYIERKSKFLLLDDLGREAESHSGWSNGRVFNVMRYRFNRCLPTIITTNLPLSELDDRYTLGLSSFLHEATVLVVMVGEDYRCDVDN